MRWRRRTRWSVGGRRPPPTVTWCADTSAVSRTIPACGAWRMSQTDARANACRSSVGVPTTTTTGTTTATARGPAWKMKRGGWVGGGATPTTCRQTSSTARGATRATTVTTTGAEIGATTRPARTARPHLHQPQPRHRCRRPGRLFRDPAAALRSLLLMPRPRPLAAAPPPSMAVTLLCSRSALRKGRWGLCSCRTLSGYRSWPRW